VIMITPKPTENGSSNATFVIQTVHGNSMTVSIDQLPAAIRARITGKRPAQEAAAGSSSETR